MRSKSIRLPLAAAALSLAMLTSCGAPGGADSSVSSASSSGSGAQSAPAAVQVEPLTVQDFPCSTTEEFTALFQKMVQETPDQIYYNPYTGLFQEAVEADVILNVCDASSPEAEEHLQVTRELLQELGCGDVPILTVFNKCDLSPEPVRAEGPSVCISAKTGQGLPRLLEEVAAALPPDRKKVTLLLPFRLGALAEQCRREGAVEREEYVAEGLSMTVTLGVRMLDAVKDYIV